MLFCSLLTLLSLFVISPRVDYANRPYAEVAIFQSRRFPGLPGLLIYRTPGGLRGCAVEHPYLLGAYRFCDSLSSGLEKSISKSPQLSKKIGQQKPLLGFLKAI